MSKTTELIYGTFTDETCISCKKSDKYTLLRTTEYRTFLFFTLGVIERIYYKQCASCFKKEEIDESTASSIIAQNFYDDEKNITDLD